MFPTRFLRSALVVAEHNNSTLSPSTLSAVTAAAKFGQVTVLVAGSDCAKVADQAAKINLVQSVILHDDAVLKKALAENLSK